jgi:formiminotetrahydrofolate cyclodeaminase
MAAALVSMVCRLTIGRRNFANVEAHLQEILAKSEALRARLSQMVAEDAQAIEALMTAYRLPKGSEAEQAVRQAAIQAGAKKAALSPLAVAQACAKIIELGREAASIGNPNALGDARAGIICAQAGLKIAAMDVLLNLELVKDEAFVTNFRAELNRIMDNQPADPFS